MTEYKIEDGIPVPKIHRVGPRRGAGMSGAIQRLEVGQSVLFPANDGPQSRKLLNIVGGATRVIRLRYSPEKKFVMRTVEGGVRVWRTA